MARLNLFLITPAIPDASAFAPALRAVMAAAPVAAVLLNIPAKDEKDFLRAAKLLVPPVQEGGAAALLAAPADPRLVAYAGADGAHYPCTHAGLADAIQTLKPKSIVGVGALKARHEAMEAGESDIDYLMFGEPRADGSIPDTERTVERAQWWAEIFNTPAVAVAADLASVSAMVATGAEFLGVGPWLFAAADPAATLAEVVRLAGVKDQGDKT